VVVYVVYIGARVAYVGITNSLKRRAREHAKKFGKDAILKEVKQCDTRTAARKYEQGGIEKYGKDNLDNLRNSFSKKNPKYQDYLKDTSEYQSPFP
jgi:predicted GIY-YIG superfamily endonuclease